MNFDYLQEACRQSAFVPEVKIWGGKKMEDDDAVFQYDPSPAGTGAASSEKIESKLSIWCLSGVDCTVFLNIHTHIEY